MFFRAYYLQLKITGFQNAHPTVKGVFSTHLKITIYEYGRLIFNNRNGNSLVIFKMRGNFVIARKLAQQA